MNTIIDLLEFIFTFFLNRTQLIEINNAFTLHGDGNPDIDVFFDGLYDDPNNYTDFSIEVQKNEFSSFQFNNDFYLLYKYKGVESKVEITLDDCIQLNKLYQRIKRYKKAN